MKEQEKYSINVRFEGDAKSEIETVIGKQQTKVVERLFDNLNSFKKTTVLTVLPELMAQLSNIINQERINIIKRHGIDTLKVLEELNQKSTDDFEIVDESQLRIED